ncbi:MAG: serine/threonine protein kinase, partial [Roseimicrobium sp.]
IGTAGVVYCATQVATGHDVTFKVLTEEASHPLEPARILALRWRLDALRHPVIAELVDAYEDPDGFVIATAWLADGIGGNDFPVKRGPLSKAEARLVAMRLCGALLAGEQAHFPHGDLKPSNVILADRGLAGFDVQIQDWGLSSCRESQPVETLQFMAPERHHGHPASLQGDLFSAAATLYFLLTGTRAADGDTPEELLYAWGARGPNALAAARPDLDAHFCQWIGWLLRWQPGDRPQSVAQALEVLDQCVNYAATLEAQSAVEQSRPVAIPERAAVAAPKPRPASRPLPTGKPLMRLPQPAAPPTHPPPPAARRAAAPPTPDEPRKPAANRAQLAMAAVMILCAVAGLGITFVMWAEDKWGPHWRTEMAAEWAHVWRKEPPATMIAEASPATAAAPVPPPSVATKAKPAPTAKPAPQKAPVKIATDNFAYATGTDLNGANGGTGWQSGNAWQAVEARVADAQDKKSTVVRLGGSKAGSMQRLLGTTAKLKGEGLCVLFTLWHPGADGPTMEFDVLDTSGSNAVPIVVVPQGQTLRISVKGGTEVLEQPAGKAFTIALKWLFKGQKRDGTIEVQAYLNPNLNSSKSAIDARNVRRVMSGYTLPDTFTVSLRTTGPCKQPATIADLRVAPT